MKGRKGRSGVKGELVEKSIDAYVLALETINRLSIKYRVESFAYLICNAWELLLKARLIETEKSRDAIYYRKKRNELKRTLSLRDSVAKVIPSDKDPVRRNLEKVAELRDDATHFVISEYPRDVLLLFQACIINYHRRLNHWFSISLADRVSVGMMTIVYDLSPGNVDLTSAALQRRIGKDVAKYLQAFQGSIQNEFEDLGRAPEYSIGIEYKLVLTKKPGEADIVLSTGEGLKTGAIVQVAKDPSITHPYRQKELVKTLNADLAGKAVVNQFDIQSINKAHGVKKKPEWFYQGKVTGSPSQYSEAFKGWILGRFVQDPKFFEKSRASAKGKKK
ncbi:MAG: DUF3644 domain-containing protein [Chromatiales bacterium]|nr:DUF3644 domain-containing protein [Chromatiales bacterium]